MFFYFLFSQAWLPTNALVGYFINCTLLPRCPLSSRWSLFFPPLPCKASFSTSTLIRVQPSFSSPSPALPRAFLEFWKHLPGNHQSFSLFRSPLREATSSFILIARQLQFCRNGSASWRWPWRWISPRYRSTDSSQCWRRTSSAHGRCQGYRSPSCTFSDRFFGIGLGRQTNLMRINVIGDGYDRHWLAVFVVHSMMWSPLGYRIFANFDGSLYVAFDNRAHGRMVAFGAQIVSFFCVDMVYPAVNDPMYAGTIIYMN